MATTSVSSGPPVTSTNAELSASFLQQLKVRADPKGLYYGAEFGRNPAKPFRTKYVWENVLWYS